MTIIRKITSIAISDITNITSATIPITGETVDKAFKVTRTAVSEKPKMAFTFSKSYDNLYEKRFLDLTLVENQR